MGGSRRKVDMFGPQRLRTTSLVRHVRITNLRPHRRWSETRLPRAVTVDAGEALVKAIVAGTTAPATRLCSERGLHRATDRRRRNRDFPSRHQWARLPQ